MGTDEQKTNPDTIHDQTDAHSVSETPGGSPRLSRGTNLGRFLVIDQIGAGGMGVVYAAYDAVLDRKVAVKLLRSDASIEAAAVMQDRLMREARAMARVAHPNVNTVFDVDTYRGQVFVAMELIDGVTLTEWLREPNLTWREVVNVFLQAGRGLAAAHRAGLVHRDVKPDNVLVGRDGRVQVTDFGLVSSGNEPEAGPSKDIEPSFAPPNESQSLTAAGAVMGSPAYMSPEQYQGKPTSVSSDQFSFCVALYEALWKNRPFSGETSEQLAANIVEGRRDQNANAAAVPAWLRALVLRGLSIDATDRFPSMDALLTALASDPGLKRRRMLVWAAVAAALVIGGWGLVTGLTGKKTTACRNIERHLSGVWDADRKQSVKRAFAASGRPYHRAIFRRVRSLFDRYTTHWVAVSRQNCRATHVHGDQSDTVFDLRRQCLKRRLSELDALVTLLAEKTDGKVLDKAVKAAYGLTPLEVCSDVRFLKTRVPLPENPLKRKQVEALRARIDKAKALVRVGGTKKALKKARSMAAEVDKLDYPPVRAEALLLLGDLQSKTHAVAAAEKTLKAAGQAAARAKNDRLQAHILTKLIYLIGNLSDRRTEALALEAAAEMAVTRAGGGKLLWARLLNAVGVVYDTDGKYAKAVDYHRRALKLFRQALGERHPKVAISNNNLGVALKEQGKYDQAIKYYRKAQSIREKVLDPRHPDMGNTLNNLGVVFDEKEDDDTALKYYRQALTIWTNALGPDNPRVAFVTHNIGTLHAEHGRYEKALEWYRKSLDLRTRLFGKKHQYTLRVRQNIAIAHELQGKVDLAFVEFVKILKLNKEVLGPEHPGVASTLNRLGNCYFRRGKTNKAIATYRRALAIYEKAGGPGHMDLAGPLNNLARVYARTGKLKAARIHAERARAILVKTFHASHPGVAEIMVTLAHITRLEGNPQKALAHLQKALPILEKKLGENTPQVAAARAESAKIKKALAKRR